MDFIYLCPTWALLAVLLTLMFFADEIGYRLGVRGHQNETEPSRTVSNALKGSVFGLVALLLGFSFAATSSRHDQRRKVVLAEANALGTCYLRAGLLEEPERGRIREGLRQYLSVRLEHFEKGLDPIESRRTGREMDRLLAKLWDAVAEAKRKNREEVLVSQIVPATNEVIDLNSTRDWMMQNRLPVSVLVLLTVSVVVSSMLIGHSCGQSGRRHAWLWVCFNGLLALVLFVILDFDRPRRGLILVDHAPLIELKATFDAQRPRTEGG